MLLRVEVLFSDRFSADEAYHPTAMKRTLAFSFILSLIVGTAYAVPQAPGQGLRMMAVRSEAEAVDLRVRIQGGESFEELARKYSIDPSAGTGGYLGTFVLPDLRREFQEGLHGLSPGDVSPVIRIGGEFFLLQFISERETRWQGRMEAAKQALQRARFLEAEELIQEAVREAEGFGPQDVRLGTSLKALGTLYWARGDYARAATLYERVVAIREKALGADDSELGVSLGNLAGIYREQGDYARAKPLYERALTIREKVLSDAQRESEAELVQLAELTRHFAELYEEQEDHARAAPLYERALEILKKALGPEHPDVGANLLNLAALYHNRRDYARAEPLYERALAILEKAAGSNHPEVAASLVNLARFYLEQENYARAEPLYERALAIYENVLGPDDTRLIQTLEGFAELLVKIGRAREAEQVRTRSIRAGQTAHPPQH